LQSLAAKQSCRRLALDRLAQFMASETDDLIWLSVLQTLSKEGGEEAAEMAYAALGHSSSEVRHRACMHLAAHPDPRHVPLLLPTLDDSQPLVVCAAVEALAASGMDDTGPLKSLFNSTSEDVQLATATALAQLNDPAGKPALERLAYSNDPQIRARVAHAMGEHPDPTYIPFLIRFLSDHATVSHAALASLPLVVGEDISQPSNQSPLPVVERISRWKRWSERR
jgi:HEAT repeat protein